MLKIFQAFQNFRRIQDFLTEFDSITFKNHSGGIVPAHLLGAFGEHLARAQKLFLRKFRRGQGFFARRESVFVGISAFFNEHLAESFADLF